MEETYGLTRTEMEIMEYLWKKGATAPFRELAAYFNEEKDKNWKKQTLNTYLINMQRAGLIGVDKSGVRNAYYALYSREELIHRWTRKLVSQAFGGSISDLVAAFTGGKKLSPEEAERIRKLI